MPIQTTEEHIKLLSTPIQTPKDQCPYLANEVQSLSVFWATDISPTENEQLLSSGWRKFGKMNFKPDCINCQKCIPLRVRVQQFAPSKSQKKVINKNHDILVLFDELKYKDQYYELYKKHSKDRFNKESVNSEDEFIRSFFDFTGQQFLSLFFLNEQLIAYGILERGTNCISSVYFIYDPEYADRSLGTFGAMSEIAYAREMGLSYYYLGYWVADCKSLAYKANFKPYETYDWQERKWI